MSGRIRKQEVIERLCKIAERVNDEHFKSMAATDCFCGNNKLSTNDVFFQFSEKVIEFIEQAVNAKLKEPRGEL